MTPNNIKIKACDRVNRTLATIDLETNLLFDPYYDIQSHALAFGHPVAHGVHLVIDSIHLIQVSILLAVSVVLANQCNAPPGVSARLGPHCLLILLDIAAGAISTLSIATRTLSTFANQDYLAYKTTDIFKGKPPFRLNWLHQNAENTINEITYKF